MSIETQYYSRATPLFRVPRTEFNPVPDVNGIVVDFALHLPEERAVADAEGFLSMVSSWQVKHFKDAGLCPKLLSCCAPPAQGDT